MNLNDCFEKGLLRKSRFPENVVDKEINNAKRHIENAKRCIETEMFDLAIVSIYTAMFHAARSILFRDGIKERSHICVLIYIQEKYPNLDEYARGLDNYRRSRHTMLYGIDVEMIAEDAIYGLSLAKKFIETVQDELQENDEQ